MFYTKNSMNFTLRKNIYFVQNIIFFYILSLLKFKSGFNLKNFNQNHNFFLKLKQKIRFLSRFFV
jgi:hypothetical protein